MKYWLILIPLITLLTGCAIKHQLQPKEFHLTSNAIGTLPLPSRHQPMEHAQLLTTDIRNRQISFIGVVSISKDQIELLALTPVGVRIFKTVYDGQNVVTEKYIPNIPLPDMTNTIANIMLSYYAPSVWSDHLPTGWKVIDKDLERFIQNTQNEKVMTIRYHYLEQERIPSLIQNHILNYTIVLKNLED